MKKPTSSPYAALWRYLCALSDSKLLPLRKGDIVQIPDTVYWLHSRGMMVLKKEPQ